MNGFIQEQQHYVKYYGAYRVVAHKREQKLKNGYAYTRYYARIPVGYCRAKGMEEKKMIKYGNTLEQLDEELRHLFRMDGFEPISRRPGLQIREYSLEWYETQKARWKPKTQKEYWRILNKIIHEIGDIEVARLTDSQVDLFLLQMDGEIPSGAGKYKTVLKDIMSHARGDGLAERNPVKTKLKKVEHQPRPFLEKTQIKPFLQEAEKEGCREISEFMIQTGARPAEAIGMTWDRYNEDKASVYIDQQYQDGELTSTKTSTGREIWYLDAEGLRDLMGRTKAVQEELRIKAGSEWNNSMNLAFAEKLGSAQNQRKLGEKIRRIGKRMGIPGLSPYSLRHTYASHAYSTSHDIEIVQKNLGHKNLRTTMIYIGTLEEDKEKMRKKMSGYWEDCKSTG